MVEGRIVQGVVVGDGSDIGGGASIMGTLSGGGTDARQHRRALPARGQRRHRHRLGDDCVVEAGLYVTAGTKVTLDRTAGSSRPRELSGASGLLLPPQLRERRGSRRARAPARASSSTAPCMPTPEHAARLHAPHRPSAPAAAGAAVPAVARPARRGRRRRLPRRQGRGHATSAPPSCQATALGRSETFTPEQTANAATIAGVAVQRGLPARAATIAHRDGDPGVQAAQHRLRRPRLPRPVPAAAEPGLGHRRSR